MITQMAANDEKKVQENELNNKDKENFCKRIVSVNDILGDKFKYFLLTKNFFCHKCKKYVFCLKDKLFKGEEDGVLEYFSGLNKTEKYLFELGKEYCDCIVNTVNHIYLNKKSIFDLEFVPIINKNNIDHKDNTSTVNNTSNKLNDTKNDKFLTTEDQIKQKLAKILNEKYEIWMNRYLTEEYFTVLDKTCNQLLDKKFQINTEEKRLKFLTEIFLNLRKCFARKMGKGLKIKHLQNGNYYIEIFNYREKVTYIREIKTKIVFNNYSSYFTSYLDDNEVIKLVKKDKVKNNVLNSILFNLYIYNDKANNYYGQESILGLNSNKNNNELIFPCKFFVNTPIVSDFDGEGYYWKDYNKIMKNMKKIFFAVTFDLILGRHIIY